MIRRSTDQKFNLVQVHQFVYKRTKCVFGEAKKRDCWSRQTRIRVKNKRSTSNVEKVDDPELNSLYTKGCHYITSWSKQLLMAREVVGESHSDQRLHFQPTLISRELSFQSLDKLSFSQSSFSTIPSYLQNDRIAFYLQQFQRSIHLTGRKKSNNIRCETILHD